MPELKTDGYQGWWEVKLYTGKDKNGVKQGKEVFRNMLNGEIYDPGEKGWDGSPPYPTGSIANCRHNSELYRRNYERIVWDKDRDPDQDINREYDVSMAICTSCNHQFIAIYDVDDYPAGEYGICPNCQQITGEIKEDTQ